MTAISWKNGVNGNWSDAADWSGGAVPQSTDAVTIAAAGTYTLTITAAEAAASVTLAAAGATLADSSSLALGTSMLVSAGTLALASGGSVTGGTLTVSSLGSLLATGADSISSAIADSGAIDVASGTLSLTGGGSLGGSLSGAGTLLLGSGTYTTAGGTFASTGTLAIDGAELGGPGTIALGGTTTILDAGGQVAAFIGGNAVWQNSSVVNDAGLIDIGAYGDTGNTIVNQAGAQFNFTDDDGSLNVYGGPYGTATFTNAGTLAKTSGTGTSTINATLNNTGLIKVASGTIDLLGGGSLGGSLSGAGTLLLGNGTYTTAGGTFASTGTLDINGAELGGPGTIALGGTTTILDAGGQVAAFIGGNAVWQNSSVVNDAGLIDIGVYGDTANSIINLAGAQFNLIDNDASLNAYGGPYGTATFANAGTLAKTSGTGTSTISATVNNTGLIKVASGTLDLDGGGSLGGTLSGAGTLALGGGTFTSNGGTLAGTINLAINGDGDLAIAAGKTLTLSDPVSFGITSGYGETGYVTGPGTLTTTGTTTINSYGGGYPEAELGGGITWVNSGTVNDAGIIYVNTMPTDTVTITNAAGANFDLTTGNAGVFNQYSGYNPTDLFTNAGTLAATSGVSGTTVALGITVNNTGLISVASGVTLDLEDGGLLGGTLSGAGTLALDGGTFTSNGGTLAGTINLAINGDGDLAIAAGKTLTLSDPVSFGITSGYGETGYVTGPGTLTTTGTTTINSYGGGYPEAELGGGITWVNSGTVNDAGIISVNTVPTDTVTITNAAGANFDLTTGNAGVFNQYSGYNPTDLFTNAGTLAATSGVSGTTVALGITVNNTGLISVASGATLNLNDGGSLGGTLSGAGTLGLEGGTFTSTVAVLKGAANLAFDGGTLTVSGASGTLRACQELTARSTRA